MVNITFNLAETGANIATEMEAMIHERGLYATTARTVMGVLGNEFRANIREIDIDFAKPYVTVNFVDGSYMNIYAD